MIRAMLEAYRRTLEKTMAQARSMDQVVAESAIPLIENARRRRRVGRRARPPGRGRAGARADGRGPPGGPVVRRPTSRPGTGRRGTRAGRAPTAAAAAGARADELLADPELRRHDGRARDDRELARRRPGRAAAAAGSAAALRRRRRRGRRRVLALVRAPRAGGAGPRDPGPARYTRAMGATDTMEVFFELLNDGRRRRRRRADGRAHRDADPRRRQRADAARRRAGRRLVPACRQGLKMVPGDVRDLGNTYQADLIVLRPGAPQPAPRRPVPRRGRQDHLDQPDALLAGRARAAVDCRDVRTTRRSSLGHRDRDLVPDADLVRVLDLRVGGQELLDREAEPVGDLATSCRPCFTT